MILFYPFSESLFHCVFLLFYLMEKENFNLFFVTSLFATMIKYDKKKKKLFIYMQKLGLQRCGKSCRLRWLNYLRPGIKRGKFTPQEEEEIIKYHALLGNR